jgi:hypothetical protein
MIPPDLFVPDSHLSIHQIATWSYVTGQQYERDFWSKCIFCKHQNRVRLGKQLAQVELVTCDHYVRHEFSKTEGVLRFTFAQ